MPLNAIGPALRVDVPNLRAFAPSSGALEGGGHVLAWTVVRDVLGAHETDIVFQLFDALGGKVGLEKAANTLFGSDQSEVDITALNGGGFLVSWRSFDEANLTYDVKAQRFDGAGGLLGDEFMVHSASAKAQVDPAIAALPGGGFVVSWQDTFGDGDNNVSEVKAQLFNAAGGKLGKTFVVNAETDGFQWTPSVTALKGGGFVVVYDSDGDIKGQVFDADGDERGGEFRANRTTAGEHLQPQVSALAGGGFVVVWVQDTGIETTGEGQVLAQRFDADGARVGPAISVDAGISGAVERTPAVTALHDGGFLVGWTSGTEFELPDTAWLQQFDAQGQPVGVSVAVGTAPGSDNNNLDLVTLANGDVLVSWDARPDDEVSVEHVFSQVFRTEATGDEVPGLVLSGDGGGNFLIGGAGDDEIRAGAGNDLAQGLAGDDEIEGGSGRDTLSGGDGADTIGGGSNGDRIDGGRGDDLMDGGSGEDLFVFRAAADAGESDVIRHFERADRVALLDGVSVANVAATLDVTGDGIVDTVLTLSNGAEVVLSAFRGWSPAQLV